MLMLHRASDGAPIYIAAALVASAKPDSRSERTEVCAGNSYHTVRESPDEVARLVAEAQRPAAGVDLEAVATARKLLMRLTGVFTAASVNVQDVGDAIDDVLATEVPSWCQTATRLRYLADRLGGAP